MKNYLILDIFIVFITNFLFKNLYHAEASINLLPRNHYNVERVIYIFIPKMALTTSNALQ